MLVSKYGKTTCALQVGGLFVLGAAVSAGVHFGVPARPELTLLGLIPVAFGLIALRYALYSIGDLRDLLAGPPLEER